MKRILLFILLIANSIFCQAATKINGVFKVADQRKFTIYLKEILGTNDLGEPYEQEMNIAQKRSFSMKLDVKKPAFYLMVVVTELDGNKSVHNNTVYLRPNDKLQVEFTANDQLGLFCNYSKITNTDNRALSEINEKFNDHFRALFKSNDDVWIQRESLSQFYTLTEEVLKNERVSPEVRKYLEFKAFDTYNTHLYRMALDYNRQSKTKSPIEAKFYEQPVDPLLYFNDPTIFLFPNTASNVARYLEVKTGMPVYKSRKTLDEISGQISLLKSKITSNQLIDQVIGSMLNTYINTYNSFDNFEQDKVTFAVVTQQMNDVAVRGRVKRKFENLKYTMKGSALPDLKFENMAGESVGLEQFKGKYLFIDVWASWCVPCIKMTPLVQELEKQYEGKNITFVALSIDANKHAWLNKMKELNMHGHQFLDQTSAFAKELNITGIPHYMVYDPEGKLVVYQAPMPSSPKLKEVIDQLPGL